MEVRPYSPSLDAFVIHAHRDSKIANGEFWHSDVSCDEVPPLERKGRRVTIWRPSEGWRRGRNSNPWYPAVRPFA